MDLVLGLPKSGGALPRAAYSWRMMVSGFILLSMAACARELPTLEPADLPVSEVLERLEQRRRHISGFRAVATLRLEGNKQRYSGRAFLLSRFPQSLRFEVVGFFGQPLLYIVSDGNTFTTWEPGSNHAYRGLASGEMLTSLLGFPLNDKEALALLAGIVPAWSFVEARLFRERDSEKLMLLLEDGPAQLVQRVWLETDALTVTRIEWLNRQEHLLEARFTDFVDNQEYSYPRRVALEGAGFSLDLNYQRFTINEPPEPGVFRLALPEGIEILPW